MTKYHGADYVCQHEGELELALRAQYDDVRLLATRLREESKTSLLMVTRGANGSVMLSGDESVHEAPALSVRAVDRTGAGDAVFAITALCVYKDHSPEIVGFIGNCVGALAVEIVCAIESRSSRGH